MSSLFHKEMLTMNELDKMRDFPPFINLYSYKNLWYNKIKE